MSTRIAQSIRNNKLRDAILPPQSRKALRKADIALTDSGQVEKKAGRSIRTPLVLTMSDDEYSYAARAGTAVRVSVHCDTAPSTGQCTVRFTQETEGSGETIIHEAYIPSGFRVYGQSVSIPILADSWIGAEVTVPNGASGVRAAFVVNVG